MKLAIVHDSFTQLGGAERVVDAFHEMFPDAPVFTLVLDRKLRDRYSAWDIRTSWLQVLYNIIPKLQYLLPLIPLAMSSLDLEGYDVVLSSSSGWAKNVRVPKHAAHICYCNTPARFLWIDKDYVHQEVPRVLRPLVKPTLNWMKSWDYKGAERVTQFLANASEVQKRIQEVYHRTSTVIYPFVDTEFWHPVQYSPSGTGGVPAAGGGGGRLLADNNTTPSTIVDTPPILGGEAPRKSDYFLLGGRLQAHKHNELIVEIFNELGLPLHVFGTGRQENYLRSIAKENIKFLSRIPDEQLRGEYSAAKGLIYPQVEDFGLMPLEAAACGTPTLAYAKGGSLETVVPGVTGELFENYDKELIKKFIKNWQVDKYAVDGLRAHAEKFNKDSFKRNILSSIGNIHV